LRHPGTIHLFSGSFSGDIREIPMIRAFFIPCGSLTPEVPPALPGVRGNSQEPVDIPEE